MEGAVVGSVEGLTSLSRGRFRSRIKQREFSAAFQENATEVYHGKCLERIPTDAALSLFNEDLSRAIVKRDRHRPLIMR